ncbi:MAG TPA: CaiB/BaiF CoA-transferase family protein [Deltaproteobacteria bacterium]|nr:CaiB/BaiF CoA-transferase family protein [Deltaproteobacteria bacterium]HPR56301.1 CaiB/BaiF CoA-transferase family protein [Deltaproteobacteria bacterium]HXK48114.1 CaiB/BaiF CoA-transferase family protein [Deltaproteobacteria bacterium]
MTDAAATKPLAGMKILDFSYLIPGPYGTMLLADMGADIIKVENSENPDIVRLMPPMVDGISAVYAHLNRGKRSLSLNLKKPEARQIIHRLVREYDVVIEQFRPGTMARLGLGYDDLARINPSLIYCSLSGFGQTGSFSGRAGHDINYLALSGVEAISGRRETGPVLSAIQIADIASGSKNLVIGVLSAYIHRMHTGRGDSIDVSITDGVFAMSVFAVAGFLAGGTEPQREDFLSGGSLYDFYATADGGYLSVGPIEGKFFAAFCEGIGCPDMAETGIINWNQKKRVAGIIAGRPLAHWREKFGDMDACVEPVYSVSQAVSNAPLCERAMVVPVRTVAGTEVNQIGNPVKFGSGHHYAGTAGVPLGHHNDEILSRLGFSPQDIDMLKESSAVGR